MVLLLVATRFPRCETTLVVPTIPRSVNPYENAIFSVLGGENGTY